jgi:hypothetical protein
MQLSESAPSVFVLSAAPAHFSQWAALVVVSLISAVSLHRALSPVASMKLLDSIYKRNRDKSLDHQRARDVRITSLLTFVITLYGIYTIIRLWQ